MKSWGLKSYLEEDMHKNLYTEVYEFVSLISVLFLIKMPKTQQMYVFWLPYGKNILQKCISA